MSVYIGHAVQDEDGKSRGGQPGDQTGKEVCTRRWYLNQKGWRVFRAKDPLVAEKIAYDMEAACANPCIGYDQSDRNTLTEIVSKLDYDCARVTKPCETDCSALVYVCVRYAGVKVGSFNTASEAKALLATGAFEELEGSKYTDDSAFLRRGDILVTCTKGHTCVVLNDGDKAYAGDTNVVYVKGRSVRVRAGDSSKTACVGIAHRGDEFLYLGTAPSGWYKIMYYGREAYITNKPQYTELR